MNKENLKTTLETAEVLSKFFLSIVNNLEISKYSKYNLSSAIFFKHIDQLYRSIIYRAILKYKNYPSIIANQNNFKGRILFTSENSKKKKFKKKSIN